MISIEQQCNVENATHNTGKPSRTERHDSREAAHATQEDARPHIVGNSIAYGNGVHAYQHAPLPRDSREDSMARVHTLNSIDKQRSMMYNDTMIVHKSNIGLGGRSNQAPVPTQNTTSKRDCPKVNIIEFIVSSFHAELQRFFIVRCGKLEKIFSRKACCFLNSESIFETESQGISHT